MQGRVIEIEKTNKKHLIKELRLVSLEDEKEFKAIGPIIYVNPGECLELTGDYIDDVFKFTKAKKTYSCEEEEINEILSLNLSFTKKQAKEAIGFIHEDLTNEEMILRLMKIHGIGPTKAERAAGIFVKRNKEERALEILAEENAKEETIIRLFLSEGAAPAALFNDPYALIDLDESFATCDKIARRLGKEMFSKERAHGLIKYLLKTSENAGNTRIDAKTLYETAEKQSGKFDVRNSFPPSLAAIYAESDEMLSVNGDSSLSFAKTEEDENEIAKALIRIANGKAKEEERNINFVTDAESALHVSFSDEQKNAFRLLNEGGIMLLSGGPGTGKTLAIAGIMNAYIEHFPQSKILLCAPTGRAAARMKELAGDRAAVSTMHKALGLSHFMKGKIEELDFDLIICDEMSMADNELMSLFLPSVKTGTKLLLAGDFNQLPSVGAGKVFRDIMESEMFPTTFLTKTMRQKDDSLIPRNAKRILLGVLPVQSGDFKITYCKDDSEIERLTESISYNKNTMVLCPLRRGRYGSEVIARKIQKKRIFKDKGRIVKFDCFHNGDIVLMTKNNYDCGYINGDIGVINSIDADSCTIRFADKCITIGNEDMTDMSLAYCMSVHKAQGSESDNILIILPEASGNLLATREILYTAVTRAKKSVEIITTKNTLIKAVANETASKRNCGLKSKLLSISA